MTVIFHDLFEETVDTLLENHTPDTGTGWVILYDSFTVAVVNVKPTGHSGVSNVVGPSASDSGAGRAFKIAPAPSAADITLETDVYDNDWSRTNTYNRGMFARDTGGQTHYAVSILPNGNSQPSVRLYKTVSGSSTLLGSYDATLVNGDVIRFECTDAVKRVLVNGVERISSTDNAITGAGDAGLFWGNWNNQDGGGHPDRRSELGTFTAESVAAGAPIDAAVTIAGAASVTATAVVTGSSVTDAAATLAGGASVQAHAALIAVVPNTIPSADSGYDAVGAYWWNGETTAIPRTTDPGLPYGETVWRWTMPAAQDAFLGVDSVYTSDGSLPVTPGQTYTFAFWARMVDGPPDLEILARFYYNVSPTTTQHPLTPFWTMFFATGVIEPGEPSAAVSIVFITGAPVQDITLELTGLMIVEGDRAPANYNAGERVLAASVASGAHVSGALVLVMPDEPAVEPAPWPWVKPAGARLYQLAFYNHHRDLVDLIDASALSEVKYSRQLNNMGALQFTLPRERVTPTFHPIRDVLVELLVSVDGGPLISEGAYLVRQSVLLPGEPEDVWIIGAVGLEHLLARRIFLADDDPQVANGYSTKYDRASEVIASVVTDQCISPATRPGRAISGLSIAPHSASGDPIPFREQSSETSVLELIKKLATAGHTDFWIDYDADAKTTPMTIGPRGADRRRATNWPISPVVYFSPDNGSMVEPELEQDYREEKNTVFVFGQGPAGGRFIYSKSSTAISISPWNRCEFGVTANQYTNLNDLFGEADAALINALANQTRLAFTVPQDGSLQYLRDWAVGDLVNAGIAGVEFDMRVAGVTVTLNAEGITVEPELVRYQI